MAITKVYTFRQKVAAVAVEYDDVVNPKTLDRGTFTISDSIYNFRFNPPEDLPKRADRTVTRVYTNDEPGLDPHGRSDRGRYVIVELAPDDPGGNAVIRSTCSPRRSERITPNPPTQVIQHENVYARSGRGKLLAAGGSTRYPLTTKPVNILADEFQCKRFEHAATAGAGRSRPRSVRCSTPILTGSPPAASPASPADDSRGPRRGSALERSRDFGSHAQIDDAPPDMSQSAKPPRCGW